MGLYNSKNLKTAKRTCDRWFNKYIRIRDADTHGKINCITCGREYDWDNCNAGHWIEASILPTRYHPHNVNAQCVHCNLSDNGFASWHGKEIALKYGKEIPDELIEISKSDKSYDKEQVMALARQFKTLAEELAEEKGIGL